MIGLTATPAAHTKAYFKDVIFRYEYSRAVREGYLVDYDAVKVKSDVRMKGVFLKDIWANRDRDYNIRCLVKRIQRIDKEMSAEAREMFARFGVPDADMGRYAFPSGSSFALLAGEHPAPGGPSAFARSVALVTARPLEIPLKKT